MYLQQHQVLLISNCEKAFAWLHFSSLFQLRFPDHFWTFVPLGIGFLRSLLSMVHISITNHHSQFSSVSSLVLFVLLILNTNAKESQAFGMNLCQKISRLLSLLVRKKRMWLENSPIV